MAWATTETVAYISAYKAVYESMFEILRNDVEDAFEVVKARHRELFIEFFGKDRV